MLLLRVSLNVAVALAVLFGVLGTLIKYFDRLMLTAVDFPTANGFETLQ